jgi:hypothetical protein
VSALALMVGCHSFSANLLSGDKADGKAGREVLPTAPGLPGKYSFRIAPYVFLSDFAVQADQPIFQELARLRDQVYQELRLPAGTAVVQVYLFEDKERYEGFMKTRYPDLPRRRAFFVAQPRPIGGTEDLLVYTFWGDHIQQDLRHELTHALLHSVIRDVPLWLDEGLAEFFELPAERAGVNALHVENLRRAAGGGFQPDLARLEGLTQVAQMNPAEYREAWAWVHLMLRTRPEAKAALVAYLQQLRTDKAPGLLRPRLAAVYPSPEDALEKHLARLAPDARRGPPARRQGSGG